jgi:4-diphosphocytidyl-2-C-methyl-D-erythritol kinase
MTTSASPTVVHARAPGKINVFLKVGALLPDGYHDVAIAYQAVSLYEDVRAFPADDFSVQVTGTVELSRVPTDASNIAIKAAQLLARTPPR